MPVSGDEMAVSDQGTESMGAAPGKASPETKERVMKQVVRAIAVGLLVAVVAAGCSDDGGDAEAEADADTEAAADSEAAEEHDHADHDHSHDDGDGELAVEDLPSEVSAETEDGRSIEVSLASECVVAGEEQTVRVEAWPGARLLYQAIYSGGVSGVDPDYPGGNDRGEAGDDGVFEGSWVVAEGAPEGSVHFGVVVIGHSERLATGFDVAGPDGSCG